MWRQQSLKSASFLASLFGGEHSLQELEYSSVNSKLITYDALRPAVQPPLGAYEMFITQVVA